MDVRPSFLCPILIGRQKKAIHQACSILYNPLSRNIRQSISNLSAIESFSSGSAHEPVAVPSRTESESSISRLATTRYNIYDAYGDPYAKQKNRRVASDGLHRTIAYLPYSHHRIDPNSQKDPAYLEDSRMPSFMTAPASDKELAGSFLHDNIGAEMMEQASKSPIKPCSNERKPTEEASLPKINRRKRRKWCCGLGTRSVLLLAFICCAVIVVVWYFVWPRWVVSIEFDNVYAVTQDYSDATVSALWQLNFTIDNSANWVPTRVKEFSVTVMDGSTGIVIGTGSSSPYNLPGRTSDLIISLPVNLFYTSNNPNDTVLMTLMTCVAIPSSSGMDDPSGIDLKFGVTETISGIAWKHTTIVHPLAVRCPH
ncbi:hypothetical protein BX666DRAFT_272178 [Dichotomocladium elegans]|nr:hypothetical protein BX666DRAFT_272178 [Dichotomocladium elegans]